MPLPVRVVAASLSLVAALVAPASSAGAGEPRRPERDQSAQLTYSVSCRVQPDGRIISRRHESLDIYEHGHLFAGRSHQSPRYRGREYGWGGRIAIADSLYSDYRELPAFLGRRAFTRIGSTDGIVYVYVQSLGCLFDRYVPRPPKSRS